MRNPTCTFSLLLCCSLWLLPAAQAQAPDTLTVALPAIQVEAARGTATATDAPFALAVLSRTAQAQASDAASSLHRVLRGLPGIWINDRGHFALGERLAIRGLGSRAAFGVRGVQVLLDGMPLTLPDGQAMLDIVEPAMVSRAELIRGPASQFWGNAGGGTLFLHTLPPADAPHLSLQGSTGSFGHQKLLARSVLSRSTHHVSAFVSDHRREGYREYSKGRFTRAGLSAQTLVGSGGVVQVHAAYADQDTEHPGSLTAPQVAQNPRAANARNVATGAGKRSEQFQGNVSALFPTSAGLLTASAHGLTRQLDNPLSFAYIGLDRAAYGTRLSLQQHTGRLEWAAGVDAGWQHDDRKNWTQGSERRAEDLRLNQQETVKNLAAFGHLSYRVQPRVKVSGGLRVDQMRFEMDDLLLTNGDQSGERTFSALSPAISLSYEGAEALWFLSYSTAFETPTTTELVNNPRGDGGFNDDLGPQRVRGVESGVRGSWGAGSLTVDLALFALQITNRLVPFQTATGDSRTFFRNGGSNRHRGVELGLGWQPTPLLNLHVTYTGGEYTYEDAPLRGNHLPGVPNHRLFAAATLTLSGFRAQASLEAVGKTFGDDENTVDNDAYTLVDVHLSHDGVSLGTARLQPFLRLDNLLDTTYNGSLVVNASFGRYFEPSPGRSLTAGLSLAL